MIQYVDNRERNSLPTRRSSDLTGGVPMLFGYPFLKGWHGTVDLPLIGPVELATAMPFDAGVFLVVIGATLTIIDLLADDSELTRLGLDQEAGVSEDEDDEDEELLDGGEGTEA